MMATFKVSKKSQSCRPPLYVVDTRVKKLIDWESIRPTTSHFTSRSRSQMSPRLYLAAKKAGISLQDNTFQLHESICESPKRPHTAPAFPRPKSTLPGSSSPKEASKISHNDSNDVLTMAKIEDQRMRWMNPILEKWLDSFGEEESDFQSFVLFAQAKLNEVSTMDLHSACPPPSIEPISSMIHRWKESQNGNQSKSVEREYRYDANLNWDSLCWLRVKSATCFTLLVRACSSFGRYRPLVLQLLNNIGQCIYENFLELNIMEEILQSNTNGESDLPSKTNKSCIASEFLKILYRDGDPFFIRLFQTSQTISQSNEEILGRDEEIQRLKKQVYDSSAQLSKSQTEAMQLNNTIEKMADKIKVLEEKNRLLENELITRDKDQEYLISMAEKIENLENRISVVQKELLTERSMFYTFRRELSNLLFPDDSEKKNSETSNLLEKVQELIQEVKTRPKIGDLHVNRRIEPEIKEEGWKVVERVSQILGLHSLHRRNGDALVERIIDLLRIAHTGEKLRSFLKQQAASISPQNTFSTVAQSSRQKRRSSIIQEDKNDGIHPSKTHNHSIEGFAMNQTGETEVTNAQCDQCMHLENEFQRMRQAIEEQLQSLSSHKKPLAETCLSCEHDIFFIRYGTENDNDDACKTSNPISRTSVSTKPIVIDSLTNKSIKSLKHWTDLTLQDKSEDSGEQSDDENSEKSDGNNFDNLNGFTEHTMYEMRKSSKKHNEQRVVALKSGVLAIQLCAKCGNYIITDSVEQSEGEYTKRGSIRFKNEESDSGASSRRASVRHEKSVHFRKKALSKKLAPRGSSLFSMLSKDPNARLSRGSSRKLPSMMFVTSLIAGIYEAKLLQDIIDDRDSQPRSSLPVFVRDYLVRQYGLKPLAMRQLAMLNRAITEYAQDNPRIRTFGWLVGSVDPETFSPVAIDYYLFVLAQSLDLGQNLAKAQAGYAIGGLNIKEKMGDGIPQMGRTPVMISSEKAYQVIAIASKPGTETDALLNKLQKVDKIDLDQFMEYSMLAWATNQDEEIEKWQKLFELADSNQDGVLTLSEFQEVVKQLDPECMDHEVVRLFDRAVNDEGVILPESFIEVMMYHERQILLRVQRAQKSNKQIAQKINQYSQERRATRKFRDVISAIIGVSTIQTTESELQTPDSREGAPAVSAIELQNKLASISEEENKKSVDAWGEWNLKSTGSPQSHSLNPQRPSLNLPSQQMTQLQKRHTRRRRETRGIRADSATVIGLKGITKAQSEKDRPSKKTQSKGI